MHSTKSILTLIFSVGFLFSAASAQISKSPNDSSTTKKQANPTGQRIDTLKQVTGKTPADTSASALKTGQKPELKKERSSTTRTVERQTATHAQKNAPRVKNAGPTNK
jgi:hypothetical protein